MGFVRLFLGLSVLGGAAAACSAFGSDSASPTPADDGGGPVPEGASPADAAVALEDADAGGSDAGCSGAIFCDGFDRAADVRGAWDYFDQADSPRSTAAFVNDATRGQVLSIDYAGSPNATTADDLFVRKNFTAKAAIGVDVWVHVEGSLNMTGYVALAHVECSLPGRIFDVVLDSRGVSVASTGLQDRVLGAAATWIHVRVEARQDQLVIVDPNGMSDARVPTYNLQPGDSCYLELGLQPRGGYVTGVNVRFDDLVLR